MSKVINNTQSAEWQAVKRFTEKRLKLLQADLERFHPVEETATLRGQIAFAREILQLGEKQANIEVPVVKYDH